MHECLLQVPSVAQLAPSAPGQAAVPGLDAEDEALADPAAALADVARLPPELAEAPPGDVDPSIKASPTSKVYPVLMEAH